MKLEKGFSLQFQNKNKKKKHEKKFKVINIENAVENVQRKTDEK